MGKLIAMAGSMAREGPIIFAKIATSPVCVCPHVEQVAERETEYPFLR